MNAAHLFALLLASIVAVGVTAVAVHDLIAAALDRARERRVRVDVARGPWGPR